MTTADELDAALTRYYEVTGATPPTDPSEPSDPMTDETAPAPNRYNELTAAEQNAIDALVNAIASAAHEFGRHCNTTDIVHVAVTAVHDRTRAGMNR